MKLEICLKWFFIAVIYLSIALGLASGYLQQFVKFNSIDSEFFMALLCGTFGLICLGVSIKIKR
jgi:hypothetical protein